MDFIAPDNFIDLGYPRFQNIDFDKEACELESILNAASKESDVQRYIKDNKKWFIPGSLFKDYDFGHHSAYLVPEQSLGAEYRADYMLLGKNSIGHQLILVEFEDVNVDYVLKTSNTETETVRNGFAQIRDWKRWIDDHRDYFLQSSGLSTISKDIPSWGIHYCIVVSRRSRMSDTANQMRLQMQHEISGLHIVTYDRLVDNVRMLSNGF